MVLGVLGVVLGLPGVILKVVGVILKVLGVLKIVSNIAIPQKTRVIWNTMLFCIIIKTNCPPNRNYYCSMFRCCCCFKAIFHRVEEKQ